MLDEVRALLVLQDRDRRLLAIGKDLERLPGDQERTKRKMANDEAARKSAQDRVKEVDLKIKRVELDAGTRKTSIARMKSQQFETRKNDEFQALGHEIARYEKEVDVLETKELELMEEMDGARDALKEAEALLAKTKEMVTEDLRIIEERRGRLEEEKREVTAARDALVATASAEWIPLYQRLMKTKDGLAIAPMSEGKCGGCHMKLIPATVVKVNSAVEIARCENCGRILYAGE